MSAGLILNVCGIPRNQHAVEHFGGGRRAVGARRDEFLAERAGILESAVPLTESRPPTS